ncbi:unnamed protein product [Rangifer tarandus platyrhynchus]|uniref:Uncharacterized protein n=1 Tax=Rangifer tarandus platyrhynchus TaxID=3082113 RepID=A0AC59ZH34_RANTA
MQAAPALESESFAVVVPQHYRWTVTRASRGVCFPVTLGEEKPGCLSNRVWLGCDDAVDVLDPRGICIRAPPPGDARLLRVLHGPVGLSSAFRRL